MSESIHILSNSSKKEKYMQLLPQIEALIRDENDFIANAANVCAALKETFNFLWVGLYIVRGEQLVLGPFQGPVACTRIGFGKGVCGTAWKNKSSIIVPDVSTFEGHIACSHLSKSEIVVPSVLHEEVVFVLDIDSDTIESFEETDEQYLTDICRMLQVSFSV